MAALLDWLQQRYPGLPLALAGFSFGSWVGLQVACADRRVAAVCGLGLPIATYDFDFLLDSVKPALFIVGTNDEFCPRDRMAAFARRLPPSAAVRWVQGADHLFTHQIDRVQDLVEDFLRRTIKGHRP